MKSDPQCLSGEGGAIHASGSGLALKGVTLRRNHCVTGALDAGCSGGAISITGWGVSLTSGADFARMGGSGEGSAIFEGCVFEGNEARGAAVRSIYSGAGQVCWRLPAWLVRVGVPRKIAAFSPKLLHASRKCIHGIAVEDDAARKEGYPSLSMMNSDVCIKYHDFMKL